MDMVLAAWMGLILVGAGMVGGGLTTYIRGKERVAQKIGVSAFMMGIAMWGVVLATAQTSISLA
ncbi:MAG: hypothetical protein O2854_05975 [Chloroflexi bacterium]|nr:hypothetical protein [Chloroflexota bacterium]